MRLFHGGGVFMLCLYNVKTVCRPSLTTCTNVHIAPQTHAHTCNVHTNTHTAGMQTQRRRADELEPSRHFTRRPHIGKSASNVDRFMGNSETAKKKLFAFAFCSSLSFSIFFCLFCCLLLIPFIVVPLRLRHSQNCFPTEKKMYIPNLLWYGSFASVQSRHLFSFYITSGIRRTTKLELHTFIYSICSKNVSSKNEAQRHGITE